MTLSLVFIACLFQIMGHVRYNNEPEINPNLTSWTIWGWTSLIDTWNYVELTNGDWQKNALSIVCSLCCLITWVILLSKGKFKKPKLKDYISLAICFGALFIWKYFDLIRESNIALQVDNVISFIPILFGIHGVYRNPTSERPLPWIWWSIPYGIGSIVVIVRLEDWVELLYPISSLVLHGLVALFAYRK